MNIWPAIAFLGTRRDLHMGFSAERIFTMPVEVRLPSAYAERVIEITMWDRANEHGTYRMIWTYSVENEHLACKELEI